MACKIWQLILFSYSLLFQNSTLYVTFEVIHVDGKQLGILKCN